jgi:methionyl-tRNA formyltransferase
MRIALLTLEALANARAVRRYVAAHAGEIALVGLSDPYRPQAGGAIGQTWRRLRQSGPRILPYLALNFALPGLVASLRRPAKADVDRTPLSRACAARGIEAVQVRDVNGAAFLAALAASGAELIVSFHFDQILSAGTIAAVPRGGINVHAGLLPHHRGPTPTIHALLDEPVRLGVSIHRLVPRIDAGALLAQAEIADEPGLTALGAAARLHEAALPLLDRLLPEIAAGTATETLLPTLPYRGFPTRAELAALARKGRKAAGLADLLAAWRE